MFEVALSLRAPNWPIPAARSILAVWPFRPNTGRRR